MARKHYPYGPSTAKRWLQCPGSVALCVDLPARPPGFSAAEGTRAHRIGELLARGQITEEVESAPEEMLKHVEHYANFILRTRHRAGYTREWIEETMEHPTTPEFGGTGDYMAELVEGKHRTLVLCDLKYGLQRVEAANNPQLLCYASLADRLFGPFDAFEVTICQPRTEGQPCDSWQFNRARLEEFNGELNRALANRDHYSPGAACVYCPALAHCPALHAATVQAAGQEIADDDYDRWQQLLALKPAIEALLAQVPDKILAAMRVGRKFEGLKAVRRYGHRSWLGHKDTVLAELRRRGLRKKDLVEEKLVSPAQLEKKGLLGVCEDLVTRAEIGISLAPESDRREAVEFATPEEMFDDLDILK